MAANMQNDTAPMQLFMVGNVRATKKFPPQFAILPKAIAAGRGPTSNNSDPMKYGIGPKPIPYVNTKPNTPTMLK